ncbi:MAG: hypothetical protein PHW02_08800, partial [bacterium]|nr:hypothetical protein [bacterium]
MKKSALIFIFTLLSLLVFARPFVIINEFMYDNAGTDTNCYVELKGTPGASLDSVKIFVINGNGGSTDDMLDLGGYVIPADSYFVIAQSTNVANYDISVGTVADYQNGTCDNILLVYDSVGLASRVTLDAVTYGLPSGSDTVFRGLVWPTYDVTPLADGSYFAYMGRHNSAMIGNNYYDYAHFMEKTPGVANPAKLDTSIYGIQYTTDISGNSPLNTKTVSCQSIVITAKFFADSMLYYGAQSDGAWNGVAIKGNIGPDTFEIGDTVLLYHGLVFERYNRTEIRSPGMERTSLSPITLAINPTKIEVSEALEPYEGVLVKFDSIIVVTSQDGNGEWRCTNFSGDTLVIDNLASYTVPSVGDTLKSITGILDYSFGVFKLQPRNTDDIEYLVVYNWSGKVSLSDAPADSSGTIVTIRELAIADTTDIHGSFAFTSVPEDTYTMVFEHTGYITDSLTFFLSGGTITNFTLNKFPTYTLSGYVGLNDNPADSSGTIISLEDSLLAFLDTTDASGFYEINEIPAGTYTLIISKPYYERDSLEIIISANYPYTTNLDRMTGTLWGYAGLNDNPADSSNTFVSVDGYAYSDTTGTN